MLRGRGGGVLLLLFEIFSIWGFVGCEGFEGRGSKLGMLGVVVGMVVVLSKGVGVCDGGAEM